MKVTVYRGKIEAFHGSWLSGIATLIISGKPVLCENTSTVRALDSCFGNVITSGHCVNNRAIRGKDICYSFDEMGLILEAFTPTREWKAMGRPAPKVGGSVEIEVPERGEK
jgi:benzoyl-CoA reductase/2-hydroxyglutaryl-CoA dehydratase subunit BcrC/BadD/HgdB